MLKKPERLNKGDRIGIFVPASPVRDSYRRRGSDLLRRRGYKPVEVENILSRQDFLAKSAEENMRDLRSLLEDDHIKALWAARGGYGSNLMLPLLDQLVVKKAKIVIGSSDISYLLWYLLDHFNMAVFYGPMVYSALAENRADLDQLESVLGGGSPPPPIKGTTLKRGRARGVLTGGCLSNLVSLLGTRFFPNLDRRILLLEDRGEKPYRLDRMLWQLNQAGIFKKIKGLLLGEFPDCFRNRDEKNHFNSRLEELFSRSGIPILADLPLGHSDRAKTVPLGVTVEMDAGKTGSLIFRENAVE